MLVNFACKTDKTNPKNMYIAVVVLDDNDKGRTIYTETIEYKIPDCGGKYWGTLKACKHILNVLNKLLDNRQIKRGEYIKIALPSTVMLGWLEKGRAVEPYRYAFDKLICLYETCGFDIEFILEKKNFNRAKFYADKKYVKVEKYQNFLEAYANM